MKAEEEDFYKVLGAKIASERSRLRITQERLGELLGLSRVSVVNIEKGKQKPSIYQLYVIADEFHISLDSLTSVYHRKEMPEVGTVQGREIHNKALLEFSNFLNKIKE